MTTTATGTPSCHFVYSIETCQFLGYALATGFGWDRREYWRIRIASHAICGVKRDRTDNRNSLVEY